MKKVYRHPVTNRFISKKAWEELQKEETQVVGSDFDVDTKYIEEANNFLEGIEREFEKAEKLEEKKVLIQEERKGWKFFFSKFWA